MRGRFGYGADLEDALALLFDQRAERTRAPPLLLLFLELGGLLGLVPGFGCGI